MPLGHAIPYCGLPPRPEALLARWNLDPVLIAALAAIWVAYTLAARRWSWPRRRAFHLGWAGAGLFLVSPLCPLSVALFSARVGQHMLLATVAAPLVAFGLPRMKASGLAANPVLAAAVFAVALGYWHTPAAYDLTFQSTLAYWTMHLSLFGSALWFWLTLMAPGLPLASAAGAIGVASAGMGMIGAVLTFAPQPMFSPHLLTADAWGLTPLEDQQLGGILMWIPGGVLMAAGLVAGLARLIGRPDRVPLQQVQP